MFQKIKTEWNRMFSWHNKLEHILREINSVILEMGRRLMGDRSQHSYRTILSMMCHLFQFAAHVSPHELCSCGNIFSKNTFAFGILYYSSLYVIIARRYNIAMLDKGALKEFHLLIFVRAIKPYRNNSKQS